MKVAALDYTHRENPLGGASKAAACHTERAGNSGTEEHEGRGFGGRRDRIGRMYRDSAIEKFGNTGDGAGDIHHSSCVDNANDGAARDAGCTNEGVSGEEAIKFELVAAVAEEYVCDRSAGIGYIDSERVVEHGELESDSCVSSCGSAGDRPGKATGVVKDIDGGNGIDSAAERGRGTEEQCENKCSSDVLFHFELQIFVGPGDFAPEDLSVALQMANLYSMRLKE